MFSPPSAGAGGEGSQRRVCLVDGVGEKGYLFGTRQDLGITSRRGMGLALLDTFARMAEAQETDREEGK